MHGVMSPAQRRDEWLALGCLHGEIAGRRAKKAFAERGWYDDDGNRHGGLMAFIRYFWSILEPETKLVEGWALYAIIEHLEAVSFGEISRLLITVPPGFMKSLCTDVFWPAWEWGALGRSWRRYVAFSYSASLTERDNERFRDLVVHDRYQRLYGKVVKPVKIGATKITNTKKGFKLASSVGGVGTGERGDCIILDDAHNIKEAESELVRNETVRWFRESMSDRLNNVALGAIVVIMQRAHDEDVAGAILSLGLPYVHLMIPMEYDWTRQVDPETNTPRETVIGWSDPRFDDRGPEFCDNELAWPERFPAAEVELLRQVKGPYAFAGQYQQSPQPRGGGIFRREWWQLWESPDQKFPTLEYVVASLDGAYTEREENDPSAMTCWGVFIEKDTNKRRIILLTAWRKHLQFSGVRIEQKPNESYAGYRQRTQHAWGLMEWVADTCERYKVDKLLIEAKASGISAAQEISNRFGTKNWGIQLMPVKGDKVARALAVQPTFSQLLVYAPDRDWAEMVIEEMSVFPKHKYDDLTDSATQAIKHLRDIGMASTDVEVAFEEDERKAAMYKILRRGAGTPLYPV